MLRYRQLQNSVTCQPTWPQWTCCRFASAAALTASLPRAPSQAPPVHSVGRLAFDASKAGLQKVDKAYVERVIAAATKSSAFYQSEQRKEAARSLRHQALVSKQRAFRRLPLEEQQAWARKAEAVEAALEATRTFDRRFIHMDLDMFYAAVEEKFDPSLRDRPFAVGSYAMLATSNYIARRFGVRSGMPGFIAKKLCPQLWIQPLHFDLYKAEAAAVRSIAAGYDPYFVTVGLDELTMDVTDYLRRKNRSRQAAQRRQPMTAEDVCSEFRARVEAATQLTCSGGVAHTAAFAKLASNVQKPNGQHVITLRTREEVLRHVQDMPVRDVPGVGSATEQQLHALGITTCKDFLSRRAELCYLFPEKTFTFYLSAGLGLVRTHVDRAIAEREALAAQASPAGRRGTPAGARQRSRPRQAAPPLLQKSTGKALTVSRGFKSPEAFRVRLRQLVRGAHDVLMQQGTGSRHVRFHLVTHDYVEHSYSTTLPKLTASYGTLCKAAEVLAKPFFSQHRDFRVIGVTFSKLQPISGASQSCTKRKARKERRNEPAASTKTRHRSRPLQLIAKATPASPVVASAADREIRKKVKKIAAVVRTRVKRQKRQC